MKFAFDLTKGEGEREAEEIYYDFQAHILKNALCSDFVYQIYYGSDFSEFFARRRTLTQ